MGEFLSNEELVHARDTGDPSVQVALLVLTERPDKDYTWLYRGREPGVGAIAWLTARLALPRASMRELYQLAFLCRPGCPLFRQALERQLSSGANRSSLIAMRAAHVLGIIGSPASERVLLSGLGQRWSTDLSLESLSALSKLNGLSANGVAQVGSVANTHWSGKVRQAARHFLEERRYAGEGYREESSRAALAMRPGLSEERFELDVNLEYGARAWRYHSPEPATMTECVRGKRDQSFDMVARWHDRDYQLTDKDAFGGIPVSKRAGDARLEADVPLQMRGTDGSVWKAWPVWPMRLGFRSIRPDRTVILTHSVGGSDRVVAEVAGDPILGRVLDDGTLLLLTAQVAVAVDDAGIAGRLCPASSEEHSGGSR